MPSYRIYLMRNNRLLSWEDVEAPHDVAAIEDAQRFRGEHYVEIWAERRKLTSFPPTEAEEGEGFMLRA